jgi:predicted acyltransferase (DUF342 family)
MLKMIQHKHNQSKRDDEAGVALASMVILMIVIFFVVSSLSMTLVSSVKLTSSYRSTVTSLAAAESGVDNAVQKMTTGQCTTAVTTGDEFVYEVYRSTAEDAPISLEDPSVSAGCPQDGDRYFMVKSTGTDNYGVRLDIVATYLWVNRIEGSNEGALVSGVGSIELSTLTIAGEDGGLVLLEGNFNCTTNTRIDGDVIVLAGTVTISNACTINGSLYASGNIAIQNPAVAVTGDIYTLGNFSTSTGSTINGSVFAQGDLTVSSGTKINGGLVGMGTGQTTIDNVTVGLSVHTNGPIRIQNGTIIGGDLTTRSTAPADVYDTNVHGNVSIAGNFSQLAASSVGGSVNVVGTGQSNIAPTAIIGGNLAVGGNISSWSTGPQVTGTTAANATVAAPPALYWTMPEELKKENYAWRDYTYDPDDWGANGYERISKTSCDYQNLNALVQEVNNLTAPTVFDLRGCAWVNMNGVNFKLQTDVAFIANAFTNVQQVNVSSADEAKHEFSFITPDETTDHAPNCINGKGESNIYAMHMTEEITGYIYTPCMLTFGGNSVINGQLYSGTARYQGGSAMTLNYERTGIPGFPVGVGEEPDSGYGFQEDALVRALPMLVNRVEE